jgi:site-specific DNA-methyltransferase (adenine-specific)
MKPYYETKQGRLYQGDCLEVMQKLADEGVKVDMVLTDPPYGTTACKWDSVIPLEPMWECIKRLTKERSAIVMTASQPFTTQLIASNMEMFKYCWVWEKNRVTGFANAKKQPLRCVEDVVVFYKKPPTYNPQGIKLINKKVKNGKSVGGNSLRGDIESSKNKGALRTKGKEYIQEFTGYPRQILKINSVGKTVHPTQKPVALMEYLIKTYTNEGDTVLDFTIGSGTTAIAAERTGRRWIGIELSEEYCEVAKQRLEKETQQ